jgi:hypothetical protein
MPIVDLIELPPDLAERTLKDALRDRNTRLHFNGRLLWDTIIVVIVHATKDVAALNNASEDAVSPSALEHAIFHFDDTAVYLTVEFAIEGPNFPLALTKTVVERVIRPGPIRGEVAIGAVSVGTTAKILELMDCVDLRKLIYLPYVLADR